jgi:DNA polymerase I-like protein with 3'-5' exonuclease and polymerase domains
MPLVQADASALEVRVAAYLSQDEVLIQEILDGVDTHRANQVAFKLPGWDVQDKTDEQYKLGRLIAKILVFRIIYGANEYSFANDPDFTSISKSKEYWKTVIDAYYDKYKGIKKWHTKLVREAVETGKVVSPTGREYIFQKYNGEYKDTQIKNYTVQGTGADIMALVRVSFFNRLKKLGLKDCLLVNTVHDSLVVDTVEENIPIIAKLFHEVFRDVPANFEKIFGSRFNLPMTCEVNAGPNWEDMQEIVDK